jgi:choice-of-anchor B domain-containing protein
VSDLIQFIHIRVEVGMKSGGDRAVVSAVAGFLFLVGTHSGLAQNGVTVIDSINQRHGGPGGSYGFYYAGCWGYVAPDGHEYALLGCYSGTSIIDLDAVPIREVAYIPGANNEWKEIKVWGQYAYAVSENSSQGLQIIDLRFLPDSARLVRTMTSIGTKNVSRSHTITVADGYLYLNGGASNGTTIYSLADPVNPVYVGEYQPTYLHDTYVRNDTLYGAAINGEGLYIASVTNKAAPVQLGRITYSGSGTHNAWADIRGSYVYTTDEIGTTQKNMKVWDISNLPTFVQQTPFIASPSTVIHNIHGRGYYVYVAHYRSGVYVADVHDPMVVVNRGGFNTYRGGGISASYAGCWGVYPYFPSGRWIASDTQTGLYLLRFDGLAPRSRPQLVLPVNGDTLRQNPPTRFVWTKAADQAEDPHYYQLHIWGPGVDTLIRSQDTALTLTPLAGYQVGQRYRWHVWTKDEFTAVTSVDTFSFVYRMPTGVDPIATEIPVDFELAQNFPNPFNPVSTIRFSLPTAAWTKLSVIDMLGRDVMILVDDRREAGMHTVLLNADGLASGIYAYRLQSGGRSVVRKMIVLK